MNEDRVRRAIVQIPAFAPLNADLRTRLANLLIQHGKPQKVAAHTILFQRGDVSNDEGLALLDGEFKVEKDGNLSIVAYGPDLIGEMAQMNPTRQRTATVTAATDLHAIRFRWPVVLQAAASSMSAAELQSVSDALQEYAWKHFTE